MSHFLALVIGQDWEEQLAPYQENTMGDCPKEYLEFFDMTEETILDYQGSAPGVFTEDGEFLFQWDDRVKKLGLKDKVTDILFTQSFPDFDTFVRKYCCYKLDPIYKKYGVWQNPNAKWDWYEPGGRWDDYFKVKPNVELSTSLLAKDINWKAMKDEKVKTATAQWEQFIQWLTQDPELRDPDIPFILNVRAADTNIEIGYESFSDFMSHETSTAPFVYVHKGVWYERSMEEEQDVWGSQFQTMLDSLDPNELVTVVDCHI